MYEEEELWQRYCSKTRVIKYTYEAMLTPWKVSNLGDVCSDQVGQIEIG